MARRHHLGHQGEGDGQQAAGRGAHQEAHCQVPGERRHRAADGRAHEHQSGEQDGGTAAINIGYPTPDYGPQGGPRQGHQREPGRSLLGDFIFVAHAGHDETQRGRLHDVYRQGDQQHGDELPVFAIEFGAVGNMERHGQPMRVPTQARHARHHAVGSQGQAGRDQEHAGQHDAVHGHPDHAIAIVGRHQKHGDMSQYARHKRGAAEPEDHRVVEGQAIRFH